MKILVDQNIPLARELFGSFGEITLVNGRDVAEGYAGLEEFDALAIRSVTRVTPALVDRAVNAKVIGTATIGTDHIDVGYIREANGRRENPITVLSAPGSNADSVADHVWFALAAVTHERGEPLSGRSLGIIGLGNCGSRVARRADGFGMRTFRYDPPLAERDPSFQSDSFEDTVAADFVTLHVPLTRAGESRHPTHHMIGAAQIARMRPTACLINTSRGDVVDSGALVEALERGSIGGAVLDVYEGEPEPREELIRLPVLATPHVAGYAVEAKRRGALVIYEQMCRAFGLEPQDTRPLLMRGFRPETGASVEFGASGALEAAADAAVRALLARIYDIRATSEELKRTLDRPARGAAFDRMRKDYEAAYGRHELGVYRVGFDDSAGAELRRKVEVRLRGFGCRIVDEGANYILRARR